MAEWNPVCLSVDILKIVELLAYLYALTVLAQDPDEGCPRL